MTGQIITTTGAAPPTPPAGTVTVYAKADKILYAKDDAGVETSLEGGGGGATDLNGLTDCHTDYANESMYVGQGAGVVPATGQENTVVGFNAGAAMTVVSSNTLIGDSAGASIGTAGGNTVVGAYTMDALTDGGENTAIGHNTLETLTTGNHNSAFGAGADTGAALSFFRLALGAGAIATADNAGQVGDANFTNLKIGDTLGSIQTGNTTNTGSTPWKLGSVVTAAAALDAAHYVEVMIGGVLVKLAIVT